MSYSPFLSLPPEIRNMIYTLTGNLPTPSSPTLIPWACCRTKCSHTLRCSSFSFALYRTCKAICHDLPLLSHLLSTGAVIPTITAKLNATYTYNQLLPGKLMVSRNLVNAKILRIVGPTRFVDGRRETEDAEGWRRWLRAWKHSRWARRVVEVFLDLDLWPSDGYDDGNEESNGETGMGLVKRIQVQLAVDERADILGDNLGRSLLFCMADCAHLWNFVRIDVLDERGARATELQLRMERDIDCYRRALEM